MEAVGGSVLFPILQVAFDRIALNQNFLHGLFPGNRKLQLNRLMRVLRIVSEVLEDAENKQARSPAMKTWFNGLKRAVYQADDVLDEINTDRLRIEVQHAESHLRDTDFSDQFIGELSPRLEEICDALERQVQQIGVLGLRILYGKQKREDKLLSTSVVEQSEIYGRDDEKEKIIQMVLSDEGATQVSVIPIIGMGGIGKTTLAQLVYNDERMNNHFEIRAWVCISEEFDVYKATKELLMEVNSSIIDRRDDLRILRKDDLKLSREEKLNRLQVKLEYKLKGKRFIIILDDIWNDNYNNCHHLMSPLNSGSRGSKIIVTTRNENIALMLQNEPFHRLKPISRDQSWSLFKLHAFDNKAHTLSHEFETFGKTIVEKCKGLPLAIKTVASALRSKIDIREWRDISSNENWMVEGDILPALSLSYKLLPSHLKSCFAFCAIYPKDTPFDKEETTLLWMANDLVQPSSRRIAQDYFEELRSRFFFESLTDKGYLMHDLVNDLAQHVNGNFCSRIEEYQLKDLQQRNQGENDLPPEVLHLPYLKSPDDTLNKFRGLSQVQSLSIRTLLSIHQHQFTTMFFLGMIPELRHIRALSLSQYHNLVIPDSIIGDLKHLRFLNLASTKIQNLPNDITKCLNLQTLILRGSFLKDLPRDIGVLINLQHLDVRGNGYDFLDNMESWLSKLEGIQNLSILVDHINGRALEQLDKLQLGRDLTIFELDNAVTVEIARSAQLKNKNCLQSLSLEWTDSTECSKDELNILAELRPHTNIRILNIKGYGGTTFPNWVGDSSFCNIETLILEDCKNCFHLPPLGLLTGLKKLEISGMHGISEFYGHKPFPLLANLKEFKVRDCKKLKSLPEQMLIQLSSLYRLEILDCPKLECFPDGSLPANLKILVIIRCKKVLKFPRNWGLQRLTSLTNIDITGLKDKLFPEEGLLPTTLQVLYIALCPNLKALNHKGFQDITSLQKLYLYGCRQLRCLPEDGLPSSLSKVGIFDCPKLEAHIQREKGKPGGQSFPFAII